MAHTPGPWIWSDDFRGLFGAGEWNAVLDYAFTEGMWLGHHNKEANARLIASAPDLLALLIELVNIEGPCPGNAAWAEKVLAAIAKATGA